MASVVSDPFGVSALAVFSELFKADELDEPKICSLLRNSLKKKSEEILNSIRGFRLEADQSFKALLALQHLQFVKELISTITAEMDRRASKYHFFLELIETLVGFGKDTSTTFIAEVGVDMSAFIDADHLASWLGLSPTSNSSADKKKSVRISHASTYLKPLLIQCTLAAIKSKKEPYFKIKYDKIKKRRGHKRAIVAIARMMVVCIYHMFRDGKPFHPTDYEELMNPNPPKPRKQDIQSAVELLESAGYQIIPASAD